MGKIFDIINIPLSFVLQFFAKICGGDFAASVAIFTLLINIVLIPLTIKSQKSAVQQARIKPKLDELKKKYGDDRQKMAQAQQKLYQDEGVSMSGGCLPLILRLVIMMSIYWLILSPLTYMSKVDAKDVKTVSSSISTQLKSIKKKDKDKYEDITEKIAWNEKSNSSQLSVVKIIRDPKLKDAIFTEKAFKKIEKPYNRIVEKDKKANINYYLFGIEKMDLTDTPHFGWNFADDFTILWLIPIGAFLSQILTSVISMAIQKKNNPEAPSMAFMMLTMPLITLFIGFGLPGGVGFYWICSSLIGGLLQAGVQMFYGPNTMLAKQRAKELVKQADFEEKKIASVQNEDTKEN